MDMKAFIDDLEARAARIRKVNKKEQSQFCSHCREPLQIELREQRPADLQEYCAVCAELFQALWQRRYFREIHIDFLLQRMGLGRLRDYLNH